MNYRALISWNFCVLFGIATCFGQDAFEKEYLKQYEQNIKLERINGNYIPKDLDDVFAQLNKLSTQEGRDRLVEGTEEEVKATLVYGLGKWMIVNWNFYEGSRLSHFLKEMGISLPDDMAQFLIVSYYRHLKGIPLDLEKRADEIFEKRKKEQKMRNDSKMIKKV